MQIRRTNFGKTFSIKTYGNSMAPFLLDGDTITIKKIPYTRIRIDDIICYRKGKKLITHRVVYKSKNFIIAKGDNNLYADTKVRESEIIGLVSRVVREGKNFVPERIYLFQSSMYWEEIGTVLDAFHKARVEYVILKGLPLYLILNKEIPRRLYADCDILIRKTHLNKAKKILVKNGYMAENQFYSKTHQILSRKVIEETYFKFSKNVPIAFDIHSEPNFLSPQLGRIDTIYPQSKIDELCSLWLQQKMTITLDGHKIHLLSREDNVLNLLLHLTHHNFCGYNRYELLSIAMKKEFDIDVLIETILRFRLENFVYPSLILLNKYYPSNKIEKIIRKLSVPKRVLKFTEEVKHVKVFNEGYRVTAGIFRFKTMLALSPMPIHMRMLTFLNVNVLYSIYWVIALKVRYYLSHLLPSRQSFF